MNNDRVIIPAGFVCYLGYLPAAGGEREGMAGTDRATLEEREHAVTTEAAVFIFC